MIGIDSKALFLFEIYPKIFYNNFAISHCIVGTDSTFTGVSIIMDKRISNTIRSDSKKNLTKKNVPAGSMKGIDGKTNAPFRNS